MYLKHGWIRFGCIKQSNSLVVLGWVGSGPNFPTCSGLGWVSQLMGWVGSGHTKWTHGQLRNRVPAMKISRTGAKLKACSQHVN